jgi:chromate transporter
MNQNLKEVAKLFFKLGFIAFGGPAAHIAMMEEEVVTKRKWMSREHFLDLMGATNLIPGPNSTEMTMHCGYHRAGVAGLFVAGISFIFPAVLLTGILAYFYVTYGKIPAVESFLYGIKPAVLAIILGAIYKLGKKALKNWQLGIIGVIVIAANWMGLSEVLAILGGGLLGIIWFNLLQRDRLSSFAPFFILWFSTTLTEVNTWKLFLVFLKVGAILFGSGYVLVAYLDGELVEGLGWLTRSELLDAIAIGQFTPGPVLSTSTFIGYQINGVGGAIAATLGIFLPSFLFVWLLNPIVPKLRQSRIAASFLDAVNISAVAIMVVVTIQLGQSVLLDWRAWLIAILSCMVFFKYKKVSVLWIVLGGAVLGYFLGLI